MLASATSLLGSIKPPRLASRTLCQRYQCVKEEPRDHTELELLVPDRHSHSHLEQSAHSKEVEGAMLVLISITFAALSPPLGDWLDVRRTNFTLTHFWKHLRQCHIYMRAFRLSWQEGTPGIWFH